MSKKGSFGSLVGICLKESHRLHIFCATLKLVEEADDVYFARLASLILIPAEDMQNSTL